MTAPPKTEPIRPVAFADALRERLKLERDFTIYLNGKPA